jgi:LemA protein
MYNGLVTSEETVNKAWANVESVYQRRADLIGNLVQNVQGAADFERGTLTDVIQARADATSVKIDPTNLNESNLAAFQQAQDQLSGTLSRLLVSVERYPELKATQSFRDLQAQLEGTENRINVERQKFNEEAQTYNTKIRRFPQNIVAGMSGFEKKAYFQAAEGSDRAPEVKFDFKK